MLSTVIIASCQHCHPRQLFCQNYNINSVTLALLSTVNHCIALASQCWLCEYQLILQLEKAGRLNFLGKLKLGGVSAFL